MMPDRFGIVGLACLDERRHLAAKDVGNRAAVAAHGVGVARALGAVGIAHAAGDQLERGDLAMRAVGQHDGERDAIKTRLDGRDACHGASTLLFCSGGT
jgi:hypothetical protein